MGFLSGVFDFLVKVVDAQAKSIDRMSDDDLEKFENKSLNRYMQSGNINDFKTVEDYREQASKAHELVNNYKEKN